MQLTVLGCRAGMPADGQASSGYLVRAGGSRLLMDCGPGVAAMLSTLLHPSEIDSVIISHMHLDHCYDLLPIGKSWLLRPGRTWLVDTAPSGAPVDDDDDRAPVRLFVPAGARAVLDQLAALFPVPTIPRLDKAFEYAFDVREYTPGDTLELPDCRVSLHLLRHAAPNCGVRIDSEFGSLAYTGDTGWTDRLLPLAQGVDILLAEASLQKSAARMNRRDAQSHGHLSATEAGELAAQAGVGQLVLTHFTSADPTWLRARQQEAAAAFAGPVHVAAPGAQFTVTTAGDRVR
jgi:ribonuclease BN (tRNA processing enzyme)